jgi:Tfp pilus assembly protein PilX
MTIPRSRPVEDQPSEQGAALVLAIVFLVAMSILVVVLGNLATEASTTTSNVRYQTTIEANAESAATFAIQQVRRSYSQAAPYGSPGNPPSPQNCLPSGALSGPLVADTPYHNSLTVFCAGTQTGSTRTVNFYVCGPSSVSVSTCISSTSNSELLFASVTYFDSPSSDLPLAASCGATSNATCGVTMSIDAWDVRTADS